MINKLKSKLTYIALGLTTLLVGTAQVQAACTKGVGGVEVCDPVVELDLPAIITKIVNWGFGFLIVLAAFFILIAAYYYLTGGMNEENIKKAKNYIIYAVMAIVIGFLSRGLVYIVKNLLGISS